MSDTFLNTPGQVTRFLGYKSVPYADWQHQALQQYLLQQPQGNEVSTAPAWMQQLQQMLPPSDVSDPLHQGGQQLWDAIDKLGGYSAIGFDPDKVRYDTRDQFMKAGLDPSAYTIDANGNVNVPMVNFDDPGHFGPFTFGGSEGNDMAGLALIASSVAGGFAGGGGDASGVPAGFGDAGYSGAAAGGGAAGGAARGVAGGSGGGRGGGSGGGGSMGDEELTFPGETTGDSGSMTPLSSDQGELTFPGETTESGSAGTPSSGIDWGSLLQNANQYKGLLGTALGAILGGAKAGSKPAGTTTTTQDVPAWLMPYVQGNLDLGSLVRNGLLASPTATSAALPQDLATINGAYLNPATNPYLDATYNHAAGLVGANVDSRFEQAGRYGSGAHQGVLQEGLNNLANTIYGGNYQQERSRQAAAISGAPAFDAGTATAGFAPLTNFNGLLPNSRSTTSPYFTNTLAGILSGATAGGTIASKL